MGLLLFFGFVFIIFQLLILCLMLSDFVVEIEACDILYNSALKKEVDIRKLKINLKIYIFKVIKILNIKISEHYCEIFKIKIQLNFIKKIKSDVENGWIFIIKKLKKINPEIKEINMSLDVGTTEPLITTFSIPVLSTIVSVFISKNVKKINKEKCKFKINPLYVNTNAILLKGNGTLRMNTLRVINFFKRGR